MLTMFEAPSLTPGCNSRDFGKVWSELPITLSFTINTESVLNLRTGDRAVVYCTRAMYALCDDRCSVQCTCCNVEVLYVHGDDCNSSGMLRQQ